MRLPNGFGSVYKLSGKRRNPWAARKTVGWTNDESTGTSKQNFKILGFFPTREKALTALTIYNENPYDISVDTITFSEVFNAWSDVHFKTIVPSAQRTWMSAYSHSAILHDMRMKDIRTSHLEGAINSAKIGTATKQRMKSLYNMIFRYSLKHEIVTKNYADLCLRVKDDGSKSDRIPFSDQEIQLLWDNLYFPYVDAILVGIYSGWRPQELSILRIEDIDLDGGFMLGGLKTDAGKNRYVPIHPRIFPLIKERYDFAVKTNNALLFYDPLSRDIKTMTYDKYRRKFENVMKKLDMKHRPHDTRHTFITMAKRVQMDEFLLKLIVGHAIHDITEKVYTHRELSELTEAISRIE